MLDYKMSSGKVLLCGIKGSFYIYLFYAWINISVSLFLHLDMCIDLIDVPEENFLAVSDHSELILNFSDFLQNWFDREG